MRSLYYFDIPKLYTIIEIPLKNNFFSFKRDILIESNRNPDYSAESFAQISPTHHFIIFIVHNTVPFIVDKQGLGLTYIIDEQLGNHPRLLKNGTKIMIPLDIEGRTEGLEMYFRIQHSKISTLKEIQIQQTKETTKVKELPYTIDIVMDPYEIGVNAYDIYAQNLTYDECIWALAEISLQLENILQISDPLKISALNQHLQFTIYENPIPLSDIVIRQRAHHIYITTHPELKDLHWLIAERQILYNKILEI